MKQFNQFWQPMRDYLFGKGKDDEQIMIEIRFIEETRGEM